MNAHMEPPYLKQKWRLPASELTLEKTVHLPMFHTLRKKEIQFICNKIKEFIYIAIDTATTHLHTEGSRSHIRNALEHGATKEEIMEVFQCVSVLGMHALTEGGPMLMQAARQADAAE